MTECLIEGVWCKLPIEIHPMHAAMVSSIAVKHPELGEVWIAPGSFPMRVA